MSPKPNKITGANAGGLSRLPVRTPALGRPHRSVPSFIDPTETHFLEPTLMTTVTSMVVFLGEAQAQSAGGELVLGQFIWTLLPPALIFLFAGW
ncbi:MAG TPA: hypothetical protein VL361_10350 [Candidatus Limnocylindrales bacterium]|jgi:hypothetical protein|nr:hypothetical protein [Candidatus Limnocylindrales bacterium]